MISLDLTKSSEVRIADDHPNYQKLNYVSSKDDRLVKISTYLEGAVNWVLFLNLSQNTAPSRF